MWVFPILIALVLAVGLLQPSCDGDTPDPTEPYWTVPTAEFMLEQIGPSWGMPVRDPQLGVVQRWMGDSLLCFDEVWIFRRGHTKLEVYLHGGIVVRMDTTDTNGPKVVVDDPPKQKETE